MIRRDCYTTSIWQANVDPYVSTSSPRNNELYDVIVIGGGITGITTALLLQEAGRKCLLLEAENICFGTTGGTTAHINTLLDTPYSTIQKNFNKSIAKQVADAARDAVNLIKSNIDKYKIDCDFNDAAAYLFAKNEDEAKELEEIYEACVEVELNVSYVDDIPLPVAFNKAMRVEGQAKFNPVKYVYALAAAFERAGGCILQQCRVTALKADSPLEVETSCGNFHAGSIVYATHIPPGVNLLHLRCAPYRTYAMAVKLSDDAYPEDLSYDMEDPYHYYRTQEINGEKYLIAGGKDHKTGQEENTEYRFTMLEATVRENFNVKDIPYKWSSQYFEPTDGLPYIGHLPGHPENIFVATGLGGNGMTYSHVAAITLRSILTNEHHPDIELFNPNRIKPVAGFANFLSHNIDAVKNFVGKLFPGEKLHELAGLAPGEGEVVNYEHEKIALYKDKDGVLHAVSPVCKHLKCEVKWNSAERSWDCPCHGARYDYDGNVLTGPADHSLEVISLEISTENKS